MQEIASHQKPEKRATARGVAVGRTRRASSRSDLAVMIAIPAPMAILGLLVLVGVGVTVAVGSTLLLVFAVTTTMDVRWWILDRRRRSAHDPSESES
jgi:uncharacterized protein (DUF2062 family)